MRNPAHPRRHLAPEAPLKILQAAADTPSMDALFFLSRHEQALGVAASDDLPAEPVADALQLDDPSALLGLADVLGVERGIRPLRDATCRSFPVWDLGDEITARIAALDDAEIDAAAERWHASGATHLDADLYELASCLGDLREAVHGGYEGERLFVLLEERAW